MNRNLNIEQPEALLVYLRKIGRIGADETPVIRVLKGGVSNRTVRLERAGGETWVLKQALEKLRVPVDWFSDPGRIHQEALGIRWLSKLAPPGSIPDLVFEDPDQHLLAMEGVAEPHQNWKDLLLKGDLNLEHVRQFAILLASIHRNARQRSLEIVPIFENRSYFESLRLEPYYSYTAARVPAAGIFLEALVEETRGRRESLVHGDFSPKNVLVRDNRLILLDHEVIHFGDPAFDLGFSLTHLLSKAHHVRDRRKAFLQAAHFYWDRYRDEAGFELVSPEFEARAVRHTVGCLLARVCGRSRLEYLDEAEKAGQRSAVLSIIPNPPRNIPAVLDAFVEQLESYVRP
ncbi:MAG: phosphotransferase family protein [Acidobacteriota bacterium]